MTPKSSAAQTVYETIAFIVAGIGLTLEPAAFVACGIFALVGAVVGKGFSPVLASRRGFWLTAASGLLFALIMLLLDESIRASDADWLAWWPSLAPQLIAIVSGLFGPLAIPFLLKRFPSLAERLVGRVLPPVPAPPDHKD